MTAKASFAALVILGVVPLLAVVAGVYRLLQTPVTPLTSPVAGLCILAYRETLDVGGHAVLIALVGALLFLGARVVWVLFKTWRSTRRLGLLPLVSARSPQFHQVHTVRAEKLPALDLYVVEAAEPLALTVGYWRPVVLISTGMVELLNSAELEAVLRHESTHVRRRDPLRTVIAEALRLGFPLVPLIGRLAQHFKVQKEVEADRCTVQQMGDARPLAGALLKALQESPRESFGAVGISPTEARIDALLGSTPPSNGSLYYVWPGLLSIAISATTATILYLIASNPTTAVLHICDV